MTSWLHRIPLVLAFVLAQTARACLLESEHTPFETGALGSQRRQDAPSDPNARPPFPDLTQFHLAIGTGDRFNDGQVVPIGFGRASAEPPEIDTVFSLAEIHSAAKALADEYGDSVELFEAPERTHDNRTMFGLRISSKDCASRDTKSYGVMLTAGIHSRERSLPDGLLYFLSDLLHADREDEGLIYGGQHYTPAQVHRALSLGLVVMPVLNPDGVSHDQTNSNCWRVNRNPGGGVDLNRNFDYVWDYETIFSRNISIAPASRRPGTEDYRGPGVASEPETKNVVWVLDETPSLRWYMDMHTFAGLVIYPWGDDVNQADDPSMNFLNESFFGKHGHVVDPPNAVYQAFIDEPTWSDISFAATRMAAAMEVASGRHMEATQSVLLYPTSGTVQDYVQARGIVDTRRKKMNSITVEFGRANPDLTAISRNGTLACPFYPNAQIYRENMLQVASGTMELLLAAAENNAGGCGLVEREEVSISGSGRLGPLGGLVVLLGLLSVTFAIA